MKSIMKCKMFRSPIAFEEGVNLEDQLNNFLLKNQNISIKNIFFMPFLVRGTTQTIVVAIFYEEINSQ